MTYSTDQPDSGYQESLIEFNAIDIKIPDESKTWDHFLIGQGGFANVYEVRIPVADTTIDGNKAALKKFKYKQFSTDEKAGNVELSKLKHEAEIISQVSHANIIRLYGVCYDAHFFGLILELCEGRSLGMVCRGIKKESTIMLRVLANWAHQISSAMKYLTDRSILHRDLKADNVLVKEQVCFCTESELTPLDICAVCGKRPLNKLQLKLTDFGLSKTTMSVGHSVVGTWAWIAPELLQQSEQSAWSEFSDVWSFGVVLWELLAREMPHAGVYPITVARLNQNGQTLQLKESWPQKWKEIMEQCWSSTPNDRPRFESLVGYFEEYTKGLVEVHISDLPLSDRKRKKRVESSKPWFPMIKNWPKTKTICLSVSTLLLLSALVFLIIKLTRSDPICSKGYVHFNETDFCYKISLLPVTQQIASVDCEDDGATLASIHSLPENTFIRNQYNEHLKDYRARVNPSAERGQLWLGGEFDRWKLNWVWSDGTPFSFMNWRMRESTDRGKYWNIMHPELNGEWRIADAKREAGYVCKKPVIEVEKQLALKRTPEVIKECADGYTWLKATGFCYRIEFDPYTFNEALQTCAIDNAHLLSIHSELEHDSVIKFYKHRLTKIFGDEAYTKRTYVWLGLTFNNSTGSWSWTNGANLTWANWAHGYPLSSELGYFWSVLDLEYEQPAEIKKDDYRNMGSANYFAFICQKNDSSVGEQKVNLEVATPKVKKVEIDSKRTKCSPGFVYFKKTGYCYKSGTEKLTFKEANRACIKDETAQLVSVHSNEENRFVSELAKDHYGSNRIYTGLYYMGNQWMHTDGSDVDYTNWDEGKPNFIYYTLSHANTQVTIVLEDNERDGKWVNQKAELKQGYVCKKKAF